MISQALTGQILQWLRIAILLPLALLTMAAPAQSQDSAPKPLKVGVYVSPPFVMESAGGFAGMAIDLWKIIADELGTKFEYTEYNTYGDIIGAVADGQVDVAVTNISITESRAQAVDFTQPWFDAGARIMVSSSTGSSLGEVFGGLGDAGHLATYAWIAAAILIASLFLTLFDRVFDKDFTRHWGGGLAQSFYHVMSVATSGKTSHKKLFGSIGTVFAALWMVCGVAVVAYVTSSVTSVMTATRLTNQINGLADLRGRLIGVHTGSSTSEYLRALGINTVSFDHMQEATDALLNGEISAIAGDSPVLEHFAHANPKLPVSVVGNIFKPEKYAFAFPNGSPLTKPASIAIIGAHEDGDLETIRAKYFGARP